MVTMNKIRTFFQDETVRVILAMVGWFGGLTLVIYTLYTFGV